jgi:hypothetical protein
MEEEVVVTESRQSGKIPALHSFLTQEVTLVR